jgi:hypothetical protein
MGMAANRVDGMVVNKFGAGAVVALRWFVGRKIKPPAKTKFKKIEILKAVFIFIQAAALQSSAANRMIPDPAFA